MRWRKPWLAAGFSWRKYVAGWASTFVVFCLLLSTLSEILLPGMGVIVFLLSLLWGLLPAIAVGYPLGLLIAGFLTHYPKKWQQLFGFFLGIAIATMLIGQLFGLLFESSWSNPGNFWGQLVSAALFGVSAAIGRLIAWNFPASHRQAEAPPH